MNRKNKNRAWPEWLPYLGGATLVSVLIVILTGMAIWQESQRHQERAVVFADNISELLSQHVSDLFSKTDILLQSVAMYHTREIVRGRLDAVDFNAHLTQHKSMFPELDEIRVLDAQGILRYGTGTINTVDVSDRDYFVRARDNPNVGLIISNPLLARLSKKWVLVMARRLDTADGSFAGVVLASFTADHFGDLFAKVNAGASGTVVLRAADMTQVARHPEVPGADNGIGNRKVSFKLQEMLKQFPQTGAYLATSPLDHTERYYSYRRVGAYPFYILVGRAKSDFLASWQMNAYLLFGLSSLMILATLGGTWRVYRLSQARASERSESHAALIFSAAPVAMLWVDAKGMVASANQTATTLLGYEGHALVGLPIENLIPQNFRAAHPQYRAEFVSHGTPRMMGGGRDLKALHHDGHEIAVKIALATIEVEGTRQAIVVLDEQTARIAAREALHEMLGLQTAILDHASYAIIATDVKGYITLFNKAAEHMLGYTAKEVVGQVTPLLIHAANHERGFEGLVAGTENGQSITYESIYRRKDGSLFPVSLSVSALWDSAGTLKGYLGIAADISERQASEKAITSALARLKLATEAAEIGIWTWHFADDSLEWDARLTEWYEAPASTPEKGLLYSHWRARVHPDDVDAAEAALAQARRTESVYDHIFRIVRSDGSIRFIHSVSILECGDADTAVRMIGVNRDITAQCELDASLRAAKEAAEAANRSKSQFLANMSHEIRTPMNGILGMLALLNDTDLDARQRDYAQKTEGAANSLLGILNDILDFSKVEAGKMDLDPEPFALADVARDVETILSGNLKGKPVALTFDLDPALPAQVIGDAGRLKQVLINLGGNAIKFTAQGEVRVRVVVRHRTSDNVVLTFEVIDTGIGLTPEQQIRVFSGFSQAEASTSRRYGGTGLGLAISQRLVVLMGGELKVNSCLGAGSTFYFDLRLPLSEPEPAALIETTSADNTVDVSAPAASLVGLRVLLVEDNLINQMVARELLERQGVWVQLAENGQQAVDALVANPAGFDVVLMDLQMPVMDGLQATRHIRQQLKLTDLPIIAMTANVMASDRADCLAAGMNDHVGKPFNVKELTRRLLPFKRP